MSKDIRKILYLMEYPIDLPGGGQESTRTLCEGLLADGAFEPVVACPRLLSKKPEDYAFSIITYPSDENREQSKLRRIANFISRIGHFRKIIDQVHPDLIHVSMSESLITFGVLRVTGFFRSIPFVYTDRGLCFGYRKHSKACIKTTMKHAARMLTTTQYNAALWQKEISTPINVIPNTVSAVFEEYDPDGRQKARDAYGIEGGMPVIGFAGRISEEKDWGRAPVIVRALADSGLEFKVALVLAVYESKDEKIAAQIKEGITSVIGEDNLIYMQDLSQKEISDYYYLVDFFVMTSSFESFGKAAVEAMSRKCIVLSTPAGGLPEVIGCKEDLYDPARPEMLAERINSLIKRPDEMEKKRGEAFDRYRQCYTMDKNISGHIKVYREILDGK